VVGRVEPIIGRPREPIADPFAPSGEKVRMRGLGQSPNPLPKSETRDPNSPRGRIFIAKTPLRLTIPINSMAKGNSKTANGSEFNSAA